MRMIRATAGGNSSHAIWLWSNLEGGAARRQFSEMALERGRPRRGRQRPNGGVRRKGPKAGIGNSPTRRNPSSARDAVNFLTQRMQERQRFHVTQTPNSHIARDLNLRVRKGRQYRLDRTSSHRSAGMQWMPLSGTGRSRNNNLSIWREREPNGDIRNQRLGT